MRHIMAATLPRWMNARREWRINVFLHVMLDLSTDWVHIRTMGNRVITLCAADSVPATTDECAHACVHAIRWQMSTTDFCSASNWNVTSFEFRAFDENRVDDKPNRFLKNREQHLVIAWFPSTATNDSIDLASNASNSRITQFRQLQSTHSQTHTHTHVCTLQRGFACVEIVCIGNMYFRFHHRYSYYLLMAY